MASGIRPAWSKTDPNDRRRRHRFRMPHRGSPQGASQEAASYVNPRWGWLTFGDSTYAGTIFRIQRLPPRHVARLHQTKTTSRLSYREVEMSDLRADRLRAVGVYDHGVAARQHNAHAVTAAPAEFRHGTSKESFVAADARSIRAASWHAHGHVDRAAGTRIRDLKHGCVRFHTTPTADLPPHVVFAVHNAVFRRATRIAAHGHSRRGSGSRDRGRRRPIGRGGVLKAKQFRMSGARGHYGHCQHGCRGNQFCCPNHDVTLLFFSWCCQWVVASQKSGVCPGHPRDRASCPEGLVVPAPCIHGQSRRAIALGRPFPGRTGAPHPIRWRGDWFSIRNARVGHRASRKVYFICAVILSPALPGGEVGAG